jgi:hypothetical protein
MTDRLTVQSEVSRLTVWTIRSAAVSKPDSEGSEGFTKVVIVSIAKIKQFVVQVNVSFLLLTSQVNGQ